MILDQVTVNELIVAFMAIGGAVTMLLNMTERFSKHGKRVEAVERRLTVVEEKLEQTDKQNKMVLEALFAILSKDRLQEEKVKDKLQDFLLNK